MNVMFLILHLIRALRQIADYSCRLNIDESNPESKVAEFIVYLYLRMMVVQ